MYKYIIYSLLIHFVSLGQLYAQKEIKIKGVVKNANTNKAIEGVRLSSRGIESAFFTDSLGQFSLDLKNSKEVVLFQIDGFQQEMKFFKNEKSVVVFLTPTSDRYYQNHVILPTQDLLKQQHVTGAKTVNARQVNRSNTYADEAIVGQFAGLQTLTKSGMPGEGTFMSLRGQRSFVGEAQPLIVVDGIPISPITRQSATFSGFTENELESILAKDIANITFLKGMDALTYGALGANGVIYIKTETADDMETKVEFETVNGITSIDPNLPLLNADQFRNYFFDMGKSVYNAVEFEEKFPFMFNDPSRLYSNNTDWFEEIYEPAFSTENILKIKGGDAIAKYALTAGYLNEKGIVKNTNVSKYFTRINSVVEVSRNLTMTVNTGFNYYQKNIAEQGMHQQTNPMLAAMHKPAILGPNLKDGAGNPYDVYDRVREFGISNPTALINQIAPDSKGLDLIFNLGLSADLTSHLKINGLVGMFYKQSSDELFIPGKTSNTIAPLEEGKAINTVRSNQSRVADYFGNLNLAYNNRINGHGIYVEAALKYLSTNAEVEFAKGINSPTDFDRRLTSTSEADGRLLEGYDNKLRWVNASGQLKYDYRNILFLGLGGSLDASSVMAKDAQKMQINPGVNAALRLNELFASKSWLNDFTIRGEYIYGGNANLPGNLGDRFYDSYAYNSLMGLVRSNIPNNSLTHERLKQWTVGTDLRLFSNRLTFSADYFQERAENLVTDLALSDAHGSNFMYVNRGEIRNEGIDLSFYVTPIQSENFQWRVGGNLSKNTSEVYSIDGSRDQTITTLTDGAQITTRVGESPYAFWGYEATGVIASDEQANTLGLKDFRGERFNAGDMLFKDQNGDGIINEADKKIIGKATPDFFGSFSTDFRYKNWSLSGLFTYSYGNDIYNAVRRSGESMTDFSSQLASVEDRWSYDGHATSMPKAEYGDPMDNSRFSSRWIEDGSYLKIKNITLSYKYPKKVWFFTQLQAYVAGENLLTWTPYLGEDPEFSYNNQLQYQGVDYGKTPMGKTYKVGVRLNF